MTENRIQPPNRGASRPTPPRAGFAAADWIALGLSAGWLFAAGLFFLLMPANPDSPGFDPARFLILEHENGIALDDSIRRLFPNRQQHDPSDLARSFALAHDESRIPIGLLYHNPDAPCYEDMSSQGVELTPQERLDGFNRVLDRITI